VVARNQSPARRALPLSVLDFLLRVSRRPANAPEDYDHFSEFVLDQLTPDQFGQLWDKYLPEIEAEAAARGVPLPDPAEYAPMAWVRRQV